MKAILINSRTKEVTKVEVGHELEDIYKILECELICAPFQYGNLDTLYVAGESLLKPLDELPGVFQFSDYTFRPLFGNGLLLGTDDEGAACDVTTSLKDIQEKVRFLPEEETEEIFLKYQYGH